MKKAIVIGASIPGLACAIRLQKAGYQVHIFEKNSFPGGKVQGFEKDGYHFQMGPTFLSMPQMVEDLFNFAGKEIDEYISLSPLEPLYSAHFNHSPQKSYPVSAALYRLAPLAEKIAPDEIKHFFSYLGDAQLGFNRSKKAFISKTFNRRRDFYNVATLKQALIIKTFTTSRKYLKAFVKNPTLADLFSFYSLFENPTALNGPSYFSFWPATALTYGLWHIKRGMGALAQALEKLFTTLGGKVDYNSPVDKILIENQMAYGVQVADQLALSDFVVCAADFPYAIKRLVRNPHVKGRYSDDKINQMEYGPSALLFCFGTNKTYPIKGAHHYFLSRDMDRNILQVNQGMMPEDPSFYLHLPTREDPDLAPEGCDSLRVLIPLSNLSVSKYGWEEERIREYRKKVLNVIGKIPGFENIKNEIVVEKVFTPLDFQSLYNAYNGACFGLSSRLNQSLYKAPQVKYKLCEKLFFVGSSLHPGAGIPFVLEGARIAADEILATP